MYTFIFAAMLVFVGFWYWPAMVVAIVCIAWQNYPLPAVLLGLVLDVFYGQPEAVSILAYNPLPFTELAIFSIALAYFGKKIISTGEWRISVGR